MEFWTKYSIPQRIFVEFWRYFMENKSSIFYFDAFVIANGDFFLFSSSCLPFYSCTVLFLDFI